ncbi:cupin domain-containing protein [Streptomyces milbemycinicus]|uniref:cupin domain-containing protein n=1 Tax=Streptomyces milbemycinicus TaxID=476552 RepID=UPI0033D8A19D
MARRSDQHGPSLVSEVETAISGQGRMGVFADSGRNRTFDYQAGDVGYVPFAMGHYIENTGSTSLRLLEMFLAPRFEDVSLAQWMALTPGELVRNHLNLNDTVMNSLRKEKQPIFRP